MFRGISENPVVPFGKKTGEATRKGMSTQYELGQDNEFKGATTTFERTFTGYKDQKLERTKPCPKPVS